MRLRWLAIAAICATIAGSTARASDLLLNKPAPVFSRADLRGEKIDLAHYRGKVVLLNFWATWCAPCRIELPHFNDWQAKYKAQGLQVLAVSMDDDPALARGVAQKLHLSFPVLMGDPKLGGRYGGVFGLPVTFLIDRNGFVRKRIEGEVRLDSIESDVKQLLSEAKR